MPPPDPPNFVLDGAPFVCPDSRDEFERRRPEIRAFLGKLLGRAPFDEPPALNPTVLSYTECDGYVRKKVRYGNESDDVVWAWLLIPDDSSVEKKLDRRPAIICLPGSFMTPNFGKDGPAGLAGPLNRHHPEAYGRDLARLGYVTLCPDYPVAGERTSPGRRAYDCTDLDSRFPAWTRVGLSAWDVSRAVDFLLTVNEVAPQLIAVTGWSQGGQMSLIGAALEPRIAAVASVCGWSPFRGLGSAVVENLVQPYNYPTLRKVALGNRTLPYDLDQVAALIAPRPFLDIRGTRDPYFPNLEHLQHTKQELEELYTLYDARDRFRMYWYDGEHAHNSDAARETQAWFYRWLWSGIAPLAC